MWALVKIRSGARSRPKLPVRSNICGNQTLVWRAKGKAPCVGKFDITLRIQRNAKCHLRRIFEEQLFQLAIKVQIF
jgi:hypothetical protein